MGGAAVPGSLKTETGIGDDFIQGDERGDGPFLIPMPVAENLSPPFTVVLNRISLLNK